MTLIICRFQATLLHYLTKLKESFNKDIQIKKCKHIYRETHLYNLKFQNERINNMDSNEIYK